MITIPVTHQHGQYPIYMGKDLLNSEPLFSKHIISTQVMIVTNDTIAEYYLDTLKSSLSQYQVDHVILPDGEQYKTLEHWSHILDTLIGGGHHRDTTLIALGGGVVGDMTGFAAACFQRGVAFIQVPTTLLSQVDASIGGKTAVDHPAGKNLIGAFHQPQAVITDITTLKTLDEREFIAGLAEIIKAAIIWDGEFFTWLEKHIDAVLQQKPDELIYTIEHACLIKKNIVMQDEREHGVRAYCNLGHTFGHAIEQNLGYEACLHGEAVAIGTRLAADLSARIGWLNEDEHSRILALLKKAHLPIDLPSDIDPQTMLAAMWNDKKILNNTLRLVLIQSIGSAAIYEEANENQLIQILSK